MLDLTFLFMFTFNKEVEGLYLQKHIFRGENIDIHNSFALEHLLLMY